MYYCAYAGSFGEFSCNPRTLTSYYLNHMVSLEGIVTKCSLVRPKVVKSVHYNERKSIWQFKEYRDQTMTANGAASTSVYPTEDESGNPVSHLTAYQNDDLTHYSSSRNMAIAHIVITKPYQSRKCQSERLRDNCPEVSM